MSSRREYDEEDVLSGLRRCYEDTGHTGVKTYLLWRKRKGLGARLPSAVRIQQLFGGRWSYALEAAGLPINRVPDGLRKGRHHSDCSQAECVLALWRAVEDTKPPGRRLTYTAYGRWAAGTDAPSPQSIRNTLGGRWSTALEEAGLPDQSWGRRDVDYRPREREEP